MLVLHQFATRAATRHAPRIQHSAWLGHRGPGKSRTLVTEAIQQASDGFLDLALAIPFPESIPPYSGTIILLTVASRLFLTVPFSIWVRVCTALSHALLTGLQAKKRQWRTEEVVVPQLMKERPAILQKVHQKMRQDGFRGTKEEAQVEYAKRAKPLVCRVILVHTV